jgi:hypothetical protein
MDLRALPPLLAITNPLMRLATTTTSVTPEPTRREVRLRARLVEVERPVSGPRTVCIPRRIQRAFRLLIPLGAAWWGRITL